MVAETAKMKYGVGLAEEMIKANELTRANGLIARLLSRERQTQYAIYAAEQVLPIFEKWYPDNYEPRMAIEAAKLFLKEPTTKNEDAADWARCGAADMADNAPFGIDSAADAAACAAETVCAFTDNAATLAESAVENACEAVRADYIRNNIRSSDDESGYADAEKEGNKMKLKIINYGLMLLNTA